MFVDPDGRRVDWGITEPEDKMTVKSQKYTDGDWGITYEKVELYSKRVIVDRDQMYELQKSLEYKSSLSNIIGCTLIGGGLGFVVGGTSLATVGSVAIDGTVGVLGLMDTSMSATVLEKAQYTGDWEIDTLVVGETWRQVNQETNKNVIYSQFADFGIKRPGDKNYIHVSEETWYKIQLMSRLR
jgi:hypothetical protein